MQSVVQFFAAALLTLYTGFSVFTNQSEPADASAIEVIGHAGSGFLYPIAPFNPFPSNSKASFSKALSTNGADGVEVDLQMSKDGRLIVFHDPNLEMVKGLSGCVSEHTADEIIGKPYQAGLIYDLFQQEKVMSFEDFLQWFTRHYPNKSLHLDVKNFDDCLRPSQERSEQMAKEVLRLLLDYQPSLNRLRIGSSDKAFLLRLKSLAPQLSLLVDTAENCKADIQWASKQQLNGIVVSSGRINAELMKAAREAGLQVVIFGGKSKATIRKLVALQPDAIQVNNVRALRSMLD